MGLPTSPTTGLRFFLAVQFLVQGVPVIKHSSVVLINTQKTAFPARSSYLNRCNYTMAVLKLDSHPSLTYNSVMNEGCRVFFDPESGTGMCSKACWGLKNLTTEKEHTTNPTRTGGCLNRNDALVFAQACIDNGCSHKQEITALAEEFPI